MEDRFTDVIFSDPFPKNARIMNLKNADLDLIWRIHSECWFFGFVIRFWILKKTQNPFSDFSKNTHPYLHITEHETVKGGASRITIKHKLPEAS